MNNLTEYLIKLQKLTNQNLEILQALNDSFFSKQTHLNVKIGDSNYAIPSFISLENKVNGLLANFENLVNSPATGEAYFNFDGNSRTIEVRKFTHTPNSLTLNNIIGFDVEQNDIFKDFLTPVPFFKVDLKSLPNDITSVNVKKIIPKNEDLKNRFIELLGEASSQNYNYSDLYKILINYKADVDYVEYDTVKTLPIRKNIGTGLYVIESIISDEIDENLDEYITLKFRSNIDDPRATNNLTYKLFDETISKQLVVGDTLITYNDTAKLEITEILKNSNTIKVKVLYGEYLNLVANSTDTELDNIDDMCKLRFYADVNYDEYKYINIPLEEDQYVYVAVAPLNSRLSIQSSWGAGLLINSYKLTNINNENIKFKDYYDANVRNIGDILFEITSTFTSPITALTKSEFNLIKSKPTINPDNLVVTQINKHLNNSVTVQNIRTLYSQKKRYQTELNEVQTNIDNINTQLASISFDDTTGMRSVYTSQLSEYNKKKNELTASITKIIDEISIAANESEIPIENAKYHIRGFFDYNEYLNSIEGLYDIAKNHVIGIDVRYRYKNLDIPQGTAQAIADKFLYSDWNIMSGFINFKEPIYQDSLTYQYQENNDNKNEPSFNQIDIPISQGETVDIELRVIYDFGYPLIKTMSDWSDVINVEFPKEYLKDVQILSIIEENNNDIETNRFTNIINEQGVPEHIGDKIIDQDITYFHRPESIASGFYTSERRIIPLKDKLTEMDTTILSIQDEIQGTSSDSLSLSISNGSVNNTLYPFQTNNISVESYSTFSSDSTENVASGTYEYNKETGVVSTVFNLVITNITQHTVKLFSLFPGNRETEINKLKYSIFDKQNYSNEEDKGVWMLLNNEDWVLQSANQLVTFRIKDAYTGEPYYKEYAGDKLYSNMLPLDKTSYENKDNLLKEYGTIVYPILRDKYSLCLDNDTTNTYKLVAPGEEITIPMIFEYKLDSSHDNIYKTMSIDIRTSLYQDPVNYTFKITAKMNNSTQDKLINSNKNATNGIKYNTIVTK